MDAQTVIAVCAMLTVVISILALTGKEQRTATDKGKG